MITLHGWMVHPGLLQDISLLRAYLQVNFSKVSLINCLGLYKFAKTWNLFGRSTI